MTSDTTPQHTILLVEDDPDGQAVVEYILTFMHIHIDVAGSAEQAEIYLFEQPHHYDAIIIDLSLPGKNGWDLLKMIRADDATQDVTCIALTGYHTPKLREEALQAGFNAYFAKPVEATQFVQALRELL